MNKWRILQIARFPCRMQWTIARICDKWDGQSRFWKQLSCKVSNDWPEVDAGSPYRCLLSEEECRWWFRQWGGRWKARVASQGSLVGYFWGKGKGVRFLVLFTNQVQHGIAGKQREGTPLVPERETLAVRLHPLQQLFIRVGKITVQCHCRYDLYSCHTCPSKKRSVVATHSDRGSGKA